MDVTEFGNTEQIKFPHAADLQIGARFVRFGDKAPILRAARATALKRILEIATEKDVDAILIAGDLFESNQIANSLVEEVFGILAAHREIPIVILPGKHPLLAQVVADVERSRLFNTGRSSTVEDAGLDEMALDEFHSLCESLNIATEALREEVFEAMKNLLIADVGETVTTGSSSIQ